MMPRGLSSEKNLSWKVWWAAMSSPGRRVVWAAMPCLTALRQEMALPSGVRGPVDFWELRRLMAARSRRDNMGAPLGVKWAAGEKAILPLGNADGHRAPIWLLHGGGRGRTD